MKNGEWRMKSAPTARSSASAMENEKWRMENEKHSRRAQQRKHNGEWKVFVFPTCGARIKKKMTGFAGCFDTRKRFCVPVMARKYRALDVSAAKSRCILPRLGAQSASNRNQTTKAPSPDEAFYFQISIDSLFPAEYFPLLFYPVHGINCYSISPFA